MKENIKGHNLLSATLVYPREGVKSVETIKKLPLKEGKEFSLKKIDFSEKLLFKESFQGDSTLKVSISAIEKVGTVNKIIKDLAKAGAVAGIGTITGGVGITVVTAMAKSFLESIFDLAKTKDKVTILGTLNVPINNDTKAGELVMNLIAPKAIKIKELKIRNGEEVLVTKTIKKGFGIAKVVLDIKKFPKGNNAVAQNEGKIHPCQLEQEVPVRVVWVYSNVDVQ